MFNQQLIGACLDIFLSPHFLPGFLLQVALLSNSSLDMTFVKASAETAIMISFIKS